MDIRRLGTLPQDLRQPGLSDPDGPLRAVPPRRDQPLRAQQVLQWREAREPAALQQSAVPRPVEDRSVVRGSYQTLSIPKKRDHIARGSYPIFRWG